MKKIALTLILLLFCTIASFAQSPDYHIEELREGMVNVRDTTGKWGYITQAEYEKHNGKWNDFTPTEYTNTPYTFAIEPKFDRADSFNGGVAIVSIDNKYGLINKQGKVVCPIIYDGFSNLNEYLTVLYRDQYGPNPAAAIFHKTTQQADPIIYNDVSVEFRDDSPLYLTMTINNKKGVLHWTGKRLLPTIYSSIESFGNQFIKATIKEGWGFIDTTGREVIGHDFENFCNGYANAIFVQSDGWRVIDITGKVIKELPEFSEIGELNFGLAYAKKKRVDQYCYIDSMGNTVIDGPFSSGEDFAENLAAVQGRDDQWGDGRWGYIDKMGKFVIWPQFDYARSFSEGLAIVLSNKALGYIDKSGRIVIEPVFSICGNFTQGLAPVAIGNKFGYINKKGEMVIDTLFSDASSFCNNRAVVYNGKKYAYIDTTGTLVTDYIFDNVFDFAEDVTAVCYKGKWGFIDKSGQMVVEAKYDDAKPYKNGMAIVKSGDYWSYIDRKGRVKFRVKCDKAERFVNGLAPIYRKQREVIFDMMGNIVVEPKYEEILNCGADGLAPVMRNGKWGYVIQNWELVLKPTYDDLRYFADDRAAIKLGEKWGYIDRNYNIIIEPTYDTIVDFSGGFASVCLDGKWGVINTEGGVVVKPRFGNIREFERGYAVVGHQAYIYPAYAMKFGVVDSTDKLVIAIKYDHIEPYDGGGLFVVGINDKYGYVDVNGRVVIDIKYDNAGQFGSSQRAVVLLGEEWYYINRNGELVGSAPVPEFYKSKDDDNGEGDYNWE